MSKFSCCTIFSVTLRYFIYDSPECHFPLSILFISIQNLFTSFQQLFTPLHHLFYFPSPFFLLPFRIFLLHFSIFKLILLSVSIFYFPSEYLQLFLLTFSVFNYSLTFCYFSNFPSASFTPLQYLHSFLLDI